jgi:uncharacterized protein (DUF58 family)
MRFGWAQVGDRLEERFTLTNSGALPALWAELVDQSTVPGYQVGRGVGLGARGRLRWREEAVCTRRGLYTLGPTSLLTSDPFGVFSIELYYPASIPFLVVPPIIPLPTIQVAPGGRAGEGRPRPNAPERTISASSVREYQPGDSLRWIHWRTSAHHDSFFVRLFDGTPAGDWWVLLDLDQHVQLGAGEDSTLEHGVVLAASLSDRGLRSRRAVGLVAHGEELVWLPPKTGDDRRWEILRALAVVSSGTRPLSELLKQTGPTFGQYASLVIITPAVDSDWIAQLVPLLRRGVTPTVLLLDRETFGGVNGMKGAAAALASLGVTYYVITPDVLDRPEARPGWKGQWEWRVLGTGRALPTRSLPDISWKVLS